MEPREQAECGSVSEQTVMEPQESEAGVLGPRTCSCISPPTPG